MADTVTARDANQRFSRLLADVEGGREVVITRRGKPVARLVPEEQPGRRRLTPAQERAAAEMLAWFEGGWRSPEGDAWPGRDAIYEERRPGSERVP